VRVRAINPPNQWGEAAPELEVSLGEGATLPGLPGPLRRSPVGGHQFGQAGSGGPHAGGKRRIAIRALRPELRLANCSRNAHLTLRQSRTPSIVLQDSATGTMGLGTVRWCARGHQRAPERPGWQGINLPQEIIPAFVGLISYRSSTADCFRPSFGKFGEGYRALNLSAE